MSSLYAKAVRIGLITSCLVAQLATIRSVESTQWTLLASYSEKRWFAMEDFNWSQATGGYGVFLVVGMLTVVLKAVFGAYFTDMVARVTTMVLAVGISVAGVLAIGAIQSIAVPWYTILASGINGLIVSGSLLGVSAVYRSRIEADKLGTPWKSPL